MPDFEMLSPADIHNEKATIEFLILRQVDRLNYLATIARANRQNKTDIKDLLYSIKTGQRRIHSMLWPYLSRDEEYQADWEKIKARFETKKGNAREVDFGFEGQEKFLDTLDDWNDILMLKLSKVGLFPRRKKQFDFEDIEETENEDKFKE